MSKTQGVCVRERAREGESQAAGAWGRAGGGPGGPLWRAASEEESVLPTH